VKVRTLTPPSKVIRAMCYPLPVDPLFLSLQPLDFRSRLAGHRQFEAPPPVYFYIDWSDLAPALVNRIARLAA
jgi:hypothetical protein